MRKNQGRGRGFDCYFDNYLARSPPGKSARPATLRASRQSAKALRWDFAPTRHNPDRERGGGLRASRSEVGSCCPVQGWPEQAGHSRHNSGGNNAANPSLHASILARCCSRGWPCRRVLLQINEVRWPPFAAGSFSALGTGFAALLTYEGHYRALAGGATIPGDRPVRPDFEKLEQVGQTDSFITPCHQRGCTANPAPGAEKQCL
jgi:hypothetical protein